MFLCAAVCIVIRNSTDKSLLHTNKVKVLQLLIVQHRGPILLVVEVKICSVYVNILMCRCVDMLFLLRHRGHILMVHCCELLAVHDLPHQEVSSVEHKHAGS